MKPKKPTKPKKLTSAISNNSKPTRSDKIAAIEAVATRGAKLTRANKKRLTELVAVIRKAKREISKSVLIMARALKEIRDDELWRATTRDGFEAWCDETDLVSANYARRLIDIVEVLPNAKALPFGVDKTWELARYAIEAERDGGAKAMLEPGATINERPVTDLDEEEIRAARMKLATNVKKAATRDPERRKQLALAEKAAKALSKRLGVNVAVTAKRDGDRWEFTLVTSAAGLEAMLANG